ncbi:hypothetical protein [Tateyamaria pelophila]|uniref:hypothetical protein n=1 Tax=Tateyamaria pelophila TaxID=328415 RepID=UPI001CBCC95F|nr:hypothetical protein [Tateyamaria pelophila]
MLKRLLTVVATTAAMSAPVAAQDERTMLSIVSTGDAQTQLMAMVLTLQTASQGVKPRILLCGPAGDIALADAPAAATAGQPPRDASPQGLMRRLMDQADATVEVCAIYLPGRGEDASVLIEGVGVADPDEIGALIANPATRVIGF